LRTLLFARRRQAHLDLEAAALARVARLDPAAQRAHELAHEVEPEPDARAALHQRAVAAHEGLEQARGVAARARAVVAHGEQGLAPGARGRDLHALGVGRVLG